MRRLLGVVVALGLGVAVLAPATLVGAGEAPPTTLPLVENEGDGIVPRPNSGTPPTEAGDRGGALQLALLGLLVVVIAGAVVVVVRQARRARGERGGEDGRR